jgi:hypothetical protein
LITEDDETPKQQLEVEIRVGQMIHRVTLESSESQRVKLTVKDPDQIDPAGWEEISRQVIRLCELGCAAKRAGLTKEGMMHVEKRFIIRSSSLERRVA